MVMLVIGNVELWVLLAEYELITVYLKETDVEMEIFISEDQNIIKF
jgi:hypothetical protein